MIALRRGESREHTAVLLRTHVFNDAIDRMAQRLTDESGYQVTLVVDATRGAFNSGKWPSIGVTKEACAAIGLYCPKDFTWRCGDYFLYLARRSLPDFSRFWMIEYDVVIQMPDFADFFSRFDAAGEIDLIAPYLTRRFRNWYWHATMAPRYEAVYGCLFPLLRVSAQALDRLLAARQADSARWVSADASPCDFGEWPNDEAFCATELINHGFRCRDLNSFGRRLYSRRTFGPFEPILASDLAGKELDGMVYHPVLSGAAFDRKVRRAQADRTMGFRQRMRFLAWSLKWGCIETILGYQNRRFWT